MEVLSGFEATAARALKPSLRRELLTQQILSLENVDVWCTTGSEDFSVDELLDFSNEGDESVEEEDEKDSSSVSSSLDTAVDVDDNNSNSSHEDFHFLTIDQFVEPADEIKELEWVSKLMDDSEFFVSYPLTRPDPVLKSSKSSKPEPKSRLYRPSFPSKTRTKRTRPAAGRVWSLACPILHDSSDSSSSSSSTEYLNKPKKKSPVQTGGGLFQRRCSHCQTQKTPQWRAGPNGPKTLCNACGVRFKSGRLFPEYRPACSPTFSREVHSNSHRKVLEMRKKKEVVTTPETPGPVQMVESY